MILGLAAIGAIFTGIIGNYVALSRLIATLAVDKLYETIARIISEND